MPFVANFSAGIEKVGSAAAGAERRLSEFNLTALRQNQVVEGVSSKLRSLLLSVTALAGAGGIGLLIKRGYDYNQSLEGQRISIAGILAANRQYVDSNGRLLDANAAFQAGLSETDGLLQTIQQRSIDTAATVPQISDAFETALSAAKSSGLKQDLNQILESTIRIVQAAGAFHVPMDQLRQEVNSLFTGQVTEDSQIAKKLGLDNATVRKAIANGKLYEEIIRRTDAISVAAKAQSDTLSGVIVNVAEMIDMTISKALNSSLGRIKILIAQVGETVMKHGPQIVAAITLATNAIGDAISHIAEWASQHAELLKDIAGIGAVAGVAIAAYGLIGAAIAAISSPVGLTIAAIVALALAWETLRKYGEIEVGGKPISAYVRVTGDVIVAAAQLLVQNLITQFQVLWHAASAIFGGLAIVITTPIRNAAALFAQLPDSVAALAPGGAAVKSFAGSVAELADKVIAAQTPFADLKALGQDFANGAKANEAVFAKALVDIEGSLKSKEKLPSIADGIFGGIVGALRKRIAEMMNAAKDAPKVSPKTGGSGGNTKPIPDEVKKAFDDYLEFVEDVKRKGAAVGDPVAEALANIERQRQQALAKLEAAKKSEKFSLFYGGHDFKADEDAINDSFVQQSVEASSSALKAVNDRVLANMRALHSATTEIQSQIEADRIAVIKDADERALAEKLNANKEWFEAAKERVEHEVDGEREQAQILAKLSAEKKRRDRRDNDEAEKAREEQLVGFGAWAEKISQTVRDKIGKIPQQVTGAVLSSIDAVQSSINGVLDDLVNGQLDLGQSLEKFAKQLGSTWSHLLSNMLTQTIATGESLTKQFRDLFANINNLHGADALFAGVGIGSMVGGIGQAASPNSYASLGGTLGGALGAIIGSVAFGQTALGAIIGSAIGTAIGGAIQKGKDQIQVAITAAANQFGLVSVVEKGISAAARGRVTRDVQRQTNDVIKSYQSLIDLFPEELRAGIRSKVKLISINGGVEAADITDENALQSLQTFLSETMPQGVFSAYADAIRKGLSLLGVSETRIKQEFQRFGDLQGKELHDAVEAYITAVVTTTSNRDRFAASFDTMRWTAQARTNETELSRISAMNGPLAQLVASMAHLDVTDQVAAAQEINRLTNEKYEKEIAYLQRIDAIQNAIAQSSQQLRDQIKLAGLDDNGKLEFDFERIRELRGQLLIATDPEQIQSITQQIHGYISQALSLGANDSGLRSQLTQIVDDIEGISGTQLAKARQAVEDQHQKTAELMASAADMLLKASTALLDAVSPTTPDTTDPVAGDGATDEPRRVRPRFRATANVVTDPVSDTLRGMTGVVESRLADMRAALDSSVPQSLAARWAEFDDGVALAVTNLRAFNQSLGATRSPSGGGTEMQNVITLLRQIADNGERELHITGDGSAFIQQLGLSIEERVIRRIRRDPDVLRGYSD